MGFKAKRKILKISEKWVPIYYFFEKNDFVIQYILGFKMKLSRTPQCGTV